MVKKLYSDLVSVCRSFYRMYFPHEQIANLITNQLKNNEKRILFVGGLTNVAQLLQDKGYSVICIDNSQEMIDASKKEFPLLDFSLMDMRALRFEEKFDALVVMGRVFTYMYTDEDAVLALASYARSVKPGGTVLVDNYEIGKIDADDYFAGSIAVQESGHSIVRASTIRRIKEHPALYTWDCTYTEKVGEVSQSFSDTNHQLRAFTKEEFDSLCKKADLKNVEHIDNFEERSFLSVLRS